MAKILKSLIILLLLLNAFSVFTLTVNAAGLVPDPTGQQPAGCPENTNCGNYQLNDLTRVALIASQFLLGIVGSLALIAFIAGGLMWLLSAGNAELVSRGKQTVIGAVIGLAIVFTSFMIIQLVFSALGIEAGQAGKWAVSGWFK